MKELEKWKKALENLDDKSKLILREQAIKDHLYIIEWGLTPPLLVDYKVFKDFV